MNLPAPPIFILGVPRSGTTLLRTILDAHPRIASGPETPWLGGHQPRSLMALWGALRDEPWGYCRSFNMPREVPTEAARAFLSVLMDRYAAARGKVRWAEKTPDNALHVRFLAELFPEARFVHLVRDGLDVAMSTSVVAEHRRGISAFLEKQLGFGPDVPPVENSPFTALLRWNHWNNLIRGSLDGLAHHGMTYERLVTEPEPTLRALTDFVGEVFDPAMLHYASAAHDYPKWEWGSADVRSRGSISSDSVGRARRELPPRQLRLLSVLAGAEGSGVPGDEHAAEVGAWLNSLAGPWGLDPVADPQGVAWLWGGVFGRSWRNRRVLAMGAEALRSPLTWVLALLGADVAVVDGGAPGADARLGKLASGLRVRIGESEGGAGAALVVGEADPGRGAALLSPGSEVFVVGPSVARWAGHPSFSARGEQHPRAAVLLRRA